MPTVPTSPYPPVDAPDIGESMPNIRIIINTLRKDARDVATYGMSPYPRFRESAGFEDRREEPWPTANLKRDVETLPQTKTDAAVLDDFKRGSPDIPPSTKLSRDLGEKDIRHLTDSEVLRFMLENEATGPDPARRKRR